LWEWRRKQSPEALKEYDDYFAPPEVWDESKKMQEAMRNKPNE